jgi:hypothetical protein
MSETPIIRGSLRDQAKLQQRCAVLVEVAKKLGTLYTTDGATVTQRHYIETILGAALWYLPTSKELWTGKISIQALRDFHPRSGSAKPRLTEDHEFPRKVSAVELMQRAWKDEDPSAAMLELYLKKYGRFNYITPTENKVLVKFQKTHLFADPESAYASANVRLLTISSAELKKILKRDDQTIDSCIARLK